MRLPLALLACLDPPLITCLQKPNKRLAREIYKEMIEVKSGFTSGKFRKR